MLVHVVARRGTARSEMKTSIRRNFVSHPVVQFFVLAGYAFYLLPAGAWWLLKSPVRLVFIGLVTASVLLYRLAGWLGVAALGAVCFLLLAAWFLRGPAAFKGWWRAHWRYLVVYLPNWPKVAEKFKDDAFPDEKIKIKEVSGNDYVDVVTAQLLPMQDIKPFIARRTEIGNTLGASGCRAVENAKSVRLINLWLWHDDPLKKLNPRPFPIPEPPADGNWYRWFQRNMLYGIYEDGSRAGIDLTQRHWFVVGKSRAGKSTSRLWPVVRMSVPMIKAEALRWCVNDWKEGMELIAGRPIFEQNNGWFSTTLEESAERLTVEVERMKKQARQMGIDTDNAKSAADIARKRDRLDKDHQWTVVVADELKTVMNGSGNEQARKTIIDAFLLIQQIGLACGYTLVAGSQKGHKDVMGELRDDFTALDCLAVEYQSESWMLFEKENCDQYDIAPHRLHIPEPEDPDQSGDQGIGWKRRPGFPRLRGTEVTNADIWDMRQFFPGAWDKDEPAPTSEPVSQVEAPAPELHFSRAPRR
jgi:hypothetical protein